MPRATSKINHIALYVNDL